MGMVRVLNAERMLEIESESITAAELDENGHLILTTYGGTPIDVGNVVGPPSPNLADASFTTKGIVALADHTLVQLGTNDDRAVTPAGLASLDGYRYYFTRIYTSSGTFLKSTFSNTKAIRVRCVGGGGAGGGAGAAPTAGNHAAGGGGGGGGYAESFIVAANIPDETFSVTIGAGGTPVSGSAGGDGGASSFGDLVSASGGAGGTATAQSALMVGAVAGEGGLGTVGTILIGGSPGQIGTGYATLGQGGAGGSSMFGGGGAGVYNGAGGGSLAGKDASNYGAGGGGAQTNQAGSAKAGGNGSSGLILVEYYL